MAIKLPLTVQNANGKYYSYIDSNKNTNWLISTTDLSNSKSMLFKTLT